MFDAIGRKIGRKIGILFTLLMLIVTSCVAYLAFMSKNSLQESQDQSSASFEVLKEFVLKSAALYENSLSIGFFDAVANEDVGFLEDAVEEEVDAGFAVAFSFYAADGTKLFLANSTDTIQDQGLEIGPEMIKKLLEKTDENPISQSESKIESNSLFVFRRFGQATATEGYMVTVLDLSAFNQEFANLKDKSKKLQRKSDQVWFLTSFLILLVLVVLPVSSFCLSIVRF